MLLLIRTHRHEVGLVEKNIGRHEGRVSKEAGVDVICMAGGLVFKLGHAVQLSELGIAVENPGELRVGVHLALDKDHGFLRVDAAGEQQRAGGNDLLAELCRLLPHGDGVHIHHGIHAVVFLLHLLPVFEGAEVISKGEHPAGLDAAEYDFFPLWRGCFTHEYYLPPGAGAPLYQ